jgi:hypothetical protein
MCLYLIRIADMRRLTMGIRSEKCVVRRFHRCANVIECTYTNLDSAFQFHGSVHHVSVSENTNLMQQS